MMRYLALCVATPVAAFICNTCELSITANRTMELVVGDGLERILQCKEGFTQFDRTALACTYPGIGKCVTEGRCVPSWLDRALEPMEQFQDVKVRSGTCSAWRPRVVRFSRHLGLRVCMSSESTFDECQVTWMLRAKEWIECTQIGPLPLTPTPATSTVPPPESVLSWLDAELKPVDAPYGACTWIPSNDRCWQERIREADLLFPQLEAYVGSIRPRPLEEEPNKIVLKEKRQCSCGTAQEWQDAQGNDFGPEGDFGDQFEGEGLPVSHGSSA